MQMCLLNAVKSQDENEILKKIDELQNIIKNHNSGIIAGIVS